jgi:hypothetical protein
LRVKDLLVSFGSWPTSRVEAVSVARCPEPRGA